MVPWSFGCRAVSSSKDIKNHQFCLCRDYSCTYGGLDEEGKPHVTNLQDFEEQIFKDLYEAIITEFPQPPAARSSLDLERSYHMHFVDDKSMHFIGRTVGPLPWLLLGRCVGPCLRRRRQWDHPVALRVWFVCLRLSPARSSWRRYIGIATLDTCPSRCRWWSLERQGVARPVWSPRLPSSTSAATFVVSGTKIAVCRACLVITCLRVGVVLRAGTPSHGRMCSCLCTSCLHRPPPRTSVRC